jgi:hypothetical protein
MAGIEKRRFKRKFIDFEADILFPFDPKETGTDRVILVDISGGGVKFATRREDRYAVGQNLVIRITLPQVGEVKAWMKGSGKVLRIELTDQSQTKEPSPEALVIVTLDVTLHLERN